MNDPVLRVLISRQAFGDDGYSRSLLLSSAAHATSFLFILIVAFLSPRPKLINVVDGFAVPLPRGGGNPRSADAAPPNAAVKPIAPPVKAPAPAALIKPETAKVKDGVAPVDRKKSLREPKTSDSREVATEKVTTKTAPQSAPAAAGLDLTALDPGVLNGTTGPTGVLGFYLAAAQNRIWATWARQIRADFTGNVKVAFTIHRDGSVDQVEIIESSGSGALDRLAQRAVLSTQLGPVPNSYDKETIVIHATFKPVS